MVSCDSNSIVRNLIAKILHQKAIFPEDYEVIIDTLQRRNDENMYLIQALKYLDLSSDMIDLLIKSYECKELFYFLYDEENNSIQSVDNNCYQPEITGKCNRFEAFVPLTQEEAKKKSFKDNENVNLPTKGNFGEVTERFQFTQLNKKGKNIMYQCERIYRIDHWGSVVELLSENVYPLQEADSEFGGLYTGILGEQFFHNNILKD